MTRQSEQQQSPYSNRHFRNPSAVDDSYQLYLRAFAAAITGFCSQIDPHALHQTEGDPERRDCIAIAAHEVAQAAAAVYLARNAPKREDETK